MKKTMLTSDTLDRFEKCINPETLTAEQVQEIEHLAYCANMSADSNENAWIRLCELVKKFLNLDIIGAENSNKSRDTITVYAVEKNGNLFRVAGYDRETALKVINDPTVKAIVKSDKLIAVDKNGVIIDTSENMKNYKNERINTWKR